MVPPVEMIAMRFFMMRLLRVGSVRHRIWFTSRLPLDRCAAPGRCGGRTSRWGGSAGA